MAAGRRRLAAAAGCLAAPAGRRPAALGRLAVVGRLPGAKYGGRRRTSAGGGVMTSGAVRRAAIDQHARTRKTICLVGRPPLGVAWVLVLSRPRLPHLGRASRSTWPSAAPRPGLAATGPPVRAAAGHCHGRRAASASREWLGWPAPGRAGGGEGQSEAACPHASSISAGPALGLCSRGGGRGPMRKGGPCGNVAFSRSFVRGSHHAAACSARRSHLPPVLPIRSTAHSTRRYVSPLVACCSPPRID